jgi:amino acid transporter
VGGDRDGRDGPVSAGATGGSELERTLGFLEAMTLGGGTMIGAGIFILPGIAAESAGPASAISYAIAGFVALLAALSLSELATGMPIAGGSYHYVNRALGSFFGSIVGWGMWTGLVFASAFYMIGFGQYIVAPVPFLDGRGFVVLLGLVGLAVLVGVNYYGTEESSSLQNVMIGAETAVVVVFVAVGVFFIVPANLEPFAPTGADGVIATTGIVFISFLGFEIIATVAGEIKAPGRTIPLSMLLSVVAVTILYVLVMLVTTGVVPLETIVDSAIPVADVSSVYLGGAGVVAIVVAAVIAAISSSNSSVLAASRVIYAMGRDGIVSNWFNASHERFYTPHRAILATGGLAAALVLLGLGVDQIVALLAEAASFSFLLTYSLVHVALVVFRRADPDEYDPSFALPWPVYPAVPVLGVVLSIVVVTQMAAIVVLVGTGIVGLGVVWYIAYARTRVVGEGLLREALPGREPPARRYRVLVPVANPAAQAGLVRLAAASAHANDHRGTPELVVVNVVRGDPDDPFQNVEADRLAHQQDLLKRAHDLAEAEGVDLRTRAVVAPDVPAALLSVVDEETPDQLMVGWDGTVEGAGDGTGAGEDDRAGPGAGTSSGPESGAGVGTGAEASVSDGERRDRTFGAVVDRLLAASDRDVSLVALRTDALGRTVGLLDVGAGQAAGVGEGAPDRAAVVAERAAEVAGVEGGVPTLRAVVTADGETGETAARERGRAALARVAEAAGLGADDYETDVIVTPDLAAALPEAVADAETVCVGLPTVEGETAGMGAGGNGDEGETPRPGGATDLAARVARHATGNVVLVRGGVDGPETRRDHTAASNGER